MKYFLHKISVLLAVMAVFEMQAQTITQSFNEPSVGEVDINYKLDTSAFTSGLPLNQIGTNQVWNLAALTGTYPVIFDSVLGPTAQASSSLYPNASYCYKQDVAYSYFRTNTSLQQTELLGIYSNTFSMTFTNTGLAAQYPISYGYSNSDQVTGTYALGTNTGVCNGSITVTADATGTLNFPFGASINNVLRLLSVQQLTMSNGPLPLGTITQYMYRFYAPQIKYPVLTIRYQRYQFIIGTPTITAIAYGSKNYFTVVGLDEQSSLAEHVQMYPNPFSDAVHVVSDAASAVKELRIISLDGREVLRSNSVVEVSLAHLPAGCYTAELYTDKGIVRKKILKE